LPDTENVAWAGAGMAQGITAAGRKPLKAGACPPGHGGGGSRRPLRDSVEGGPPCGSVDSLGRPSTRDARTAAASRFRAVAVLWSV
jgi:hypothetical protein